MPWEKPMDEIRRAGSGKSRDPAGSRRMGLPKSLPGWAPVLPGPLQLSSSGGHGAHARPKACRACTALHALVRRTPRKFLNSVLHPPGEPRRTLPKTRWASFQAFVPPYQAEVERHGL